jgi:IS30 family transposase
LRAAGRSRGAIARELGRDKSTIGRELRRNSLPEGYFPARAQARAEARRTLARRAYKLDDPALGAAVRRGLRLDWSPEQIAGRMKVEQPDEPARRLSHASIYALVRQDRAAGGALYTHLRQAHRKRRKRYGTGEPRGGIRHRVSIEQRPAVVDRKARLGDWEGDTLAGKKDAGQLAVQVERATSYTVLARLADKQAATLNRATVCAFARHGALPRETLTVDNGTEFAGHEELARRLGVDVYFARPYHAWERGLCENTNGLLRQYFPKGLDLTTVSLACLRRVERRLNRRPRKKLRYRTPEEALRGRTVAFQI